MRQPARRERSDMRAFSKRSAVGFPRGRGSSRKYRWISKPWEMLLHRTLGGMRHKGSVFARPSVSIVLTAPAVWRLGNSRGISRIPRFVSIDLEYGRAFHCRMARVVPGRRSLTRVVIAGVLAWLLALHGFAAAASPHLRLAPPAAGQAFTQSGKNCGTPRGGDPSAPCHHEHCGCCILCASSHHAGGLAAPATIPFAFAAFPLARLKIANAWRVPGVENKPPSGWTSSWSQRAPPRFS